MVMLKEKWNETGVPSWDIFLTSKQTKCYYAHCMAIYNTPQEERDIKTLEDMGFEVVNPNTQEVKDRFEAFKNKYPDINYMKFFYSMIEDCDILAFRANYDGKIAAGTGNEATMALSYGKPIFELPSMIESRVMSVKDTRQYLHEIGQR